MLNNSVHVAVFDLTGKTNLKIYSSNSSYMYTLTELYSFLSRGSVRKSLILTPLARKSRTKSTRSNWRASSMTSSKLPLYKNQNRIKLLSSRWSLQQILWGSKDKGPSVAYKNQLFYKTAKLTKTKLDIAWIYRLCLALKGRTLQLDIIAGINLN